MRKFFVILLVIFVSVFFYSCGNKGNKTEKENVKKEEKVEKESNEKAEHEEKGEKEEKSEKEENPFVAMKKFAEKVKKASKEQQGGKIVVLEEKELINALPEVSGWKLEEKPYYSKDSFGSLTTSSVRATYVNGAKSVTVSIKDTGSMSSLVTPIKMSLNMMMSHEDSNGYEKVFEYKGEKGVERYNKNDKSGDITFLVKSKYIIEISSSENVEMSTLKKFLEKINFSILK